MNTKIVVAGHICLDITPVFCNSTQEFSDLLQPGKLVEVGKAEISVGGAVSNTGLALKKMGADVCLMGKIGHDIFGDIIKNKFTEYNASDALIISKKDTTSYSIVIALPKSDRLFLHNPASNHSFSFNDIDYDLVKNARLFHFGYPPLMKRMYENDATQLVKMMSKIKENGTLTSLDMAAIDPNTSAGKLNWLKILKDTMPYIDIFTPSIEELIYMMRPERHADILRTANGKDFIEFIEVEKDINPLVDELHAFGLSIVLVKCGHRGMFLSSNSKTAKRLSLEQSWNNIKQWESVYRVDEVKSATGAGDTSIAAFVKGVVDGYSHFDCLKYAAATGANCVQTYDTLSGIMTFEELQHKINLGWEKV